MKTKSKKQRVRAIAKRNPQVDEKIVGESLELITYLRKVGIKARGFNLLRSSESRLKVKGPVVHQL
jgi:hypothetical protein